MQDPEGADSDWGRAAFWPLGARWHGIIWFLAISGAYLMTIVLYPLSSGVALVWMPNAVLVTALLRYRPRDWVYVCAAGPPAELVGDLVFGYGPSASLPLGAVNAAEAVLVVLVAARIAGGRPNIGLLSLRGTLGLVVAAVTVPALTGILGALIVSDWTFGTDYLTQWRNWWFGDSTGLLVGVPIGLLLRDARSSVARCRSRRRALASGSGAAGLIAIAAALAANGNAWGAQQTALGAAILLALAFGAVGAPIAAAATTTVTIIGVARGAKVVDSVPVDQILLFVVVAAIYAIAATTEVAEQALATRDRAQSLLKSELASAANYVSALLPPDFDGTVRVSSRLLPSQELGGDCLDIDWIDDDHLVLWLIDVSGHGVAPALMSVSVRDMLRAISAGGAGPPDPSVVLGEVNRRFAMERHNGHYLTLWYGVYQLSSRTLTYAGGGHPPALLFGCADPEPLCSQAPPVGMLRNAQFTSSSVVVPPDSELLIYSDGAFDLRCPGGASFGLDDFIRLCTDLRSRPGWNLDLLVAELQSRAPGGRLEDDCSVVRVVFGGAPGSEVSSRG